MYNRAHPSLLILGLTNFYSVHFPHYADLSAALTSKLRVTKEEGKKGSQKRLT